MHHFLRMPLSSTQDKIASVATYLHMVSLSPTHWNINSMKAWTLFCSVLKPHCLNHFQVYDKCALNIWWPNEEILLVKWVSSILPLPYHLHPINLLNSFKSPSITLLYISPFILPLVVQLPIVCLLQKAYISASSLFSNALPKWKDHFKNETGMDLPWAVNYQLCDFEQIISGFQSAHL